MSARKTRQKTTAHEASDKPQSAARGRAFWSGTITFGLVSIPVDFYPAIRDSGTRLRMFTKDGHPVGRRYMCPEHDRPLAPEEIVRGFPIESGQFVTVSDEELEEVAPEKTRDIDLTRFVLLSDLPTFLFARPYVLAPSGESTKAYRLLAATMEEAGQVGIASFVMREKAYIVAILAKGGVLLAETLRFPDELRSPESIGLPPVVEVAAPRVREFATVIDSLGREELERDELLDDAAARLAKVAQDKAERGQDLVEGEAEPESEEAAPVDLVALLKHRLEKGRPTNDQHAEPRPRTTIKKERRKAVALQEQPKSDLYERAKKLGIEGRSRMNKRDLVAAIRAAS